MERIDYDEILRTLQDAQDKLNYTDKQVAALTDTPTSTFSRYWNGKTRPSLEFIARAEKVLGVNLKPYLKPEQIDKIPDEQIAAETAQAFADKIGDKNNEIEGLQGEIDHLRDEIDERERIIRQITESQTELIRELQSSADRREERQNATIDRKNRTIIALTAVLVGLVVFMVYFMLDAFNGDWGLVRYIMDHIPQVAEKADSGREIMNGIAEMWKPM